ncbi:UTRA domain-containing protein [Streptomyces sp. NPDC097619]|uniref:UTRA domain-containing protein n=1 Tax=Streptomyces sp. NPDC097619 TaxID=3157228 RepID=UPI0033193E48
MSDRSWISSSLPYVTPQAAGAADAWTQEAAAGGRRGGQRVLYAGEEPAPPAAAALLGLEPGTLVVVRRRLIELDGEPVELTDTHYPAEIAAGTALAATAKIRGGAVTLLAALGHRPARIVEEVTARLPDPTEQALLALSATDPVLLISRTTHGPDGRPYQADLMTMPAHRQRLRYETTIG